MDSLRWILLAIGLLILLGIYLFSKPERTRRREAGEFEFRFDDDGTPSTETVPETAPAENTSIPEQIAVPLPETSRGPVLPPDPDRIVSLQLVAPKGFSADLRKVAEAGEKVGLEYGREMQILHRFHEGATQSSYAVYSVADLAKPGSLPLDDPGEQRLQGLAMFMTLPNPLSALDAWDAMLAGGRRLAELLNFELFDESGSSLSRQRIASIREEMRVYDRAHGRSD